MLFLKILPKSVPKGSHKDSSRVFLKDLIKVFPKIVPKGSHKGSSKDCS